MASRPDVVERFRSEVVTLAKINHTNIATVYAFLQEEKDFLLIMEYVRGRTLQHVIQVYGALPPVLAIWLFQQALDGIGFAHQHHIVHRDLKPSNIMLTDDDVIKVMDFGLARVLGAAHVTQVDRLIGTLEYMSPEQVHGGEADARSDIYSLGMVLYELLTGRLPFVHPNEYALMRAHLEDAPPSLREFTDAVSPELDQVVLQALAKAGEERFQSTEEFSVALTHCVAETPSRLALPPSLSTLNPPLHEPVSPDTRTQSAQIALPSDAEPTGITATQLHPPENSSSATSTRRSPQRRRPYLLASLAGVSLAVVLGVVFFPGKLDTPAPSPILDQPSSKHPLHQCGNKPALFRTVLLYAV